MKPLLILLLLSSCGGNQHLANKAFSENTFASTPREGWATDPHLSYNLFSYYPVNFYNNGIYGHYGYGGLYYH